MRSPPPAVPATIEPILPAGFTPAGATRVARIFTLDSTSSARPGLFGQGHHRSEPGMRHEMLIEHRRPPCAHQSGPRIER